MPSRVIQLSDSQWISVDGGLEWSCSDDVIRIYRNRQEIGSVSFWIADVPELKMRQQHARAEAERLARWLARGDGDPIFKFHVKPGGAKTSPVAVVPDEKLPPGIAQQRHGQEF